MKYYKKVKNLIKKYKYEILLVLLIMTFIILMIISANNTYRNKDNITRSTHIEYDLFNGDKWNNYRLGDLIRGFFYCTYLNCNNLPSTMICSNNNHLQKELKEGQCLDWMKNEWDLKYLTDIDRLYPNSYASKYVKYSGFPHTFKIYDLNIIRKIFEESLHDKPLENSLVIHLRLGDVLNGSYGNDYSYNVEHYHKLYDKIKNETKIKKVDIVTGLHKNEYLKESSDKVVEIKNIFEKSFPTEVIITKNPDKDLYYMCHSNFFARSGGGFSQLVVDYLKQDKTNIIYEK